MSSLENVHIALKKAVLSLWYVLDHVKKAISIVVLQRMFATVKVVSREMKMEIVLKSVNQHAMERTSFGPSVAVRAMSNFVHAKDF